jgi:hypothetical protein
MVVWPPQRLSRTDGANGICGSAECLTPESWTAHNLLLLVGSGEGEFRAQFGGFPGVTRSLIFIDRELVIECAFGADSTGQGREVARSSCPIACTEPVT